MQKENHEIILCNLKYIFKGNYYLFSLTTFYLFRLKIKHTTRDFNYYSVFYSKGNIEPPLAFAYCHTMC